MNDRLRLGGFGVGLLACVALLGCQQASDDGQGGAGGGSTSTSSSGGSDQGGGGGGVGGGAVGGGGEGGGGEGGGAASGWTLRTHGCAGFNRTDALLVEPDGKLWVGCGTNTTGFGLYTSSDEGLSWSAVSTSPANELTSFRVSGIERGDDGLLYVAGTNNGNSDMILSLDTSSTPAVTAKVLQAGSFVGTSFHVGDLSVLSGGRIFAESLTGHGALWRPNASTPASGNSWTDAYYWSTGAEPAYQILDLYTHEGKIYGAGSTISEPPYVFLPPRGANKQPYEMEVVALPNTGGWIGEMWGVAANDERVVVVGIDQLANVGKIFVSGADPYAPAGYTVHDLPDIVGAGGVGTWARGVCMRGDQIVVVGERQPLGSNTGLAMRSTDGGQTFTDITPSAPGASLSKCSIRADGSVVVAGAGSFFGLYQ